MQQGQLIDMFAVKLYTKFNYYKKFQKWLLQRLVYNILGPV